MCGAKENPHQPLLFSHSIRLLLSHPCHLFIVIICRQDCIPVLQKQRMNNRNRPSSAVPSSNAYRISVHRLVDANDGWSSRSYERLPPIHSLLSLTVSVSQIGSSRRGRYGSSVGKMKNMWTFIEDRRLRQLVEASPGKWNTIATSLPGRTGKQCRERWLNHLRPNIRKGNWTEHEDKIILSEQKRIGNKWTSIARLLPGRSDNSVKNRFHSTLTRKHDAQK